jgi:lysylphosphatidylglycerol synthetase-like protein (DUF2156 family)
MLSMWFSIFIFIIWKKYNQTLFQIEKKVFLFVTLGYPIIGTIIKFSYELDSIYNNWELLNRLEHFIFISALGVLIYPLFKTQLSKLNLVYFTVVYAGILIFVGNINEIFEFLLIQFYELKDENYYTDSIVDLITNIISAFLGIIILNRLKLYYLGKAKAFS